MARLRSRTDRKGQWRGAKDRSSIVFVE